MKGGPWLLIVAGLSSGGCGWIATPIDYRCDRCTQSTYAHSLTAVVSEYEFTDKRIIATFRSYLAQVPHDKLSEFVIGPTVEDTVGLGHTFDDHKGMYINPSDQIRDFSRFNRNVAKLFRLNKSAVALIKRGDEVRKIQLQGDQDPNVISAGSHQIRLESFRLTPGHDPRIIIFGIPTQDLSETEANEVFRALSGSLGSADQVDLILRSDGIFDTWDGPRIYPFSLRVPNVPAERYYAKQFIYCSGSPYPGRAGCHAGREEKPQSGIFPE